MFAWLEQTELARWVGESLWGYPILLSAHVVGLAMIVGISVVRDLRILGIVRGMPAAVLASLTRLGWSGFAVNVASGIALFSSQATVFVDSMPFLVKIGCILAAAVCGVLIQRRAAREPDRLAGTTRFLAALSLLLWIGAVSAGRLIAYF